ncbi:MAG: shikimate dehydrogenase [Armatimonadetes bacterium]|nr:shikimate dehydrogenase [Armatimonadota bacterium]
MKFAFLIHPLEPADMRRKYPFFRPFSDRMIERILLMMKPKIAGRITGIQSPDGKRTEGIFIGVALTPKMFMELPLETVYRKLEMAVELAKREGCGIVGFGAFTSVVGDGGTTIHDRTGFPITTGNSYTVATAIEGTLDACNRVGIDRKQATLAVVGATGSIGRACAEVMAPEFGHVILVGRDLPRTKAVAAEIPGAEATTDLEAIKMADVLVTVTSSDAELIQPEHLKQGAIICDVARPRDVSVRVGRERPDVLAIEGGVIEVPGNFQSTFDFGFPPGTAYACMSETFMLALEDRAECFTLGKSVSSEQVRESQEMAKRLGFKLAGYRSFERAVQPEQIERVRQARHQASAAMGG